MSKGAAPLPQAHVVARVDDVPPGGRLLVEVDGRSIGIFNVGGTFYALLNRCPHQGGPLCRGGLVARLDSPRPGEYRLLRDQMLITCPWHGWEFDIATGQSYFDPRYTRARTYTVDVEEGGEVARELSQGHLNPTGSLAKGPYVAQVYPVEIDDHYLVVTIGRR